jgi:NhaA family Na+:H+ antiporter
LWLAVKSGLCAPPANARWSELYGAALLCGIGFTMSLFIGALAFPGTPDAIEAAKIGTLAGSLLSALAGWAVLRFASRAVVGPADVDEAAEIFAADLPD